MHRHQLYEITGHRFIPVAVQTDQLKVFLQGGVGIIFTELPGVIDQFLEVFHPIEFLVAFVGTAQSGFFDDLLKQTEQLRLSAFRLASPPFHHRHKIIDGFLGSAGEELLVFNHFIHGEMQFSGAVFDRFHRLVSDSAPRLVYDPAEGKIIRRRHHPQIAEGILDFLTLIEANPAVDHIRNPLIEKRLFQCTGEVVGTVQYGNIMVVQTLGMEFTDLAGNPGGFILIARTGIMHDFLRALLVGIQILFQTMPVVFDHRVGTVENRRGAAVIPVEHDRPGSGKVFGEIQNDIDVRTPPGIDRLIGITDHIEAVFRAGKLTDELILKFVDILKLIHMDMAKALLPFGENLGIAAEHLYRPENQIIEIERIQAVLAVYIVFVDLRLGLLSAELPGQNKCPFHRDLGGLVVGDIADQRPKRKRLGIHLEFLVRFPKNALLVFLIKDREVPRPVHHQNVFPQNPHAEGVNRRYPCLTGFLRHHLLDSLLHFIGGLIGKGNRQNAAGKHSEILNQMRNAHGKNPCFPGSCSGNHTNILIFGKHCFPLFFI